MTSELDKDMAALSVSETLSYMLRLLERSILQVDDQSTVQAGDKPDPDSPYLLPGLPKGPRLPNRHWLLGWPITMNELAKLPFEHDGWPRGDFFHGILWIRRASKYKCLFIGNVLAKEGDSHYPTYISAPDDEPVTATNLISIFVNQRSWVDNSYPATVGQVEWLSSIFGKEPSWYQCEMTYEHAPEYIHFDM